MSKTILLLQQVDSLLTEAKNRDLLLQTLTDSHSSVAPTVVNLPTVGNPAREIKCLVFTANTDLPTFRICELSVNDFRHLEDIPINLSAILVPIVDPMNRGYLAEKSHFLSMAYAQRLNLNVTIAWLKEHIKKPIIIICIRNGLNGLEANELLDANLLYEFELVDFYIEDIRSFILKIRSVLSGVTDT